MSSQETRLACQGSAPEDRELTPWCSDCPLGALAAQAIRAKVDEQPVMTSVGGIERAIESVDCRGKQPQPAEATECGMRVVNGCGNPYLEGIVNEYLVQLNEPVQTDAHLLE